MELMNIPREFSSRYLNDGFSGGEKKRMEILQLAMLRPELAVLDETDSGLDIDALRTVAEGVNKFAGPEMGILIITHYQRILHLVEPDFVHVMYDGRIVKQGGPELVGLLEERGYGWIREEVEAAARSAPQLRWQRPRSTSPAPPRSIEEIRAEFPILVAAGPRAAARLPGQRRDRAEAAGGDRGARPLLARAQRERPPRRPHALRGGDRRSTRRLAATIARHLGVEPREVIFTRNVTGSLEPRRPRVGPRQRRRGRSHPADRDGAPLEHRALVPAGAGGRRGAGLGAGGRRRAPRPGDPRGRRWSAARSWSPSPTSPTCSAPSTRSPRSPDWPTRPGRSWSSTAPRPRPKLPLDLPELGADFYGFTGHKVYGPDRGGRPLRSRASSSRPWSRSKGAAR